MIFLAGEEYAVRTRIGRCSGRGSEESSLGFEQGKRRIVVLGEL